MKRRILSILLLCSMVLTTLPATAFAEEGQEAPIQETPVCSCETACTEEGMNADCPVCGAEGAAPEACEKYVPATEAAEDEPEPEPEQQPEEQPEKEPEPTVQAPAPAVQNAEGAGMPVTYAAVKEVTTEQELKDALGDSSVDTIKLTKDVTLTAKLENTRDVKLDLNGKVLNLNGNQIRARRNTLTLIDSDSSAEHKFREDASGLWVLDNGGDKKVRGGVITGGNGVRVTKNYGRFTMAGGNIVGCTAEKGGGVYVETGSGDVQTNFTMKDGSSIVGCTASKEGGGVYVEREFTMTGGSIKSCKVTNSNEDTFGGGVSVWGTFTMTGGEITGCRATVGDTKKSAYGGGVHVDGTFNMGGSAKITSCISGSDFGNGVYIRGTGTMTMDGGEISNCNDEWHIWGVYIAAGHEEGGGCLDAKGGKIKDKVFSSGGTIQNSGTSGGTVFEASVENNIATNSDGSFASASTISGGTFKDKVTNVARCTISGGIFEGQVTNSGTISDGTFKNRVTNNAGSTISGGTFEGQVTNNGTINNGTFKDEVTNNGTMTGGTSKKGITGNKPQNTLFTVTFDTDGGSTAPAAQYFLSTGGKVAKPADPTKAGYVFIDWYNGDNAYDFDQTVTTDLALKAHWLKTIPGKGTEAEPYQISNAEDLKVFRDIVNGTGGQTKKTDACGELTANIDLENEEWTPIGVDMDSAYTGTFEGNHKTITGLKITQNIQYAGLFGYINGATISNVTLKGGSIRTEYERGYAGGIVAFAQGGTITGCGNENPVTGGSFTCVGGIVGAIYDSIKIDRSYNTGTIAGTSDNNLQSRVGGLIGSSFSNNPEVIDCYNTGAVRTGEYVGGLSGYTEGSDCRFYSCYNIGSVTDGTHVGDITGDKAHCYSCYHLKTSNNNYGNGQSEEAESKTAEEFANGTVLKLLKENNVDKRTAGDPWADECKYLSVAERTLPVFKWQTNLGEHEHSWGDWSHVDGTETHKRSCTCGAAETEKCHGGTSTCTAKAKCEDCKAEYGELAAHQFTAETAAESYLASAATCTEAAVYYKSCAACGAKGTETFTVGEPLDHDWGDWTSNGDGTHTRTCSRDATHTETGDCTGGTATCMAKAECETCGEPYGETDPDNHADGCYPEWTISKTEHQQKYTLCGQVLVAKEKHTFSDWSVTKKATTKQKGEKERTCEVCEYQEIKSIPVKSGKDSDKTTKATKDAKNGSPKTGDSSNVPLWTALLCVSAVGVTGTVLSRKRKRTK